MRASIGLYPMTNRAESEQRTALFTMNDLHGGLVRTSIIFSSHFVLCFLILHLVEAQR